MWQQLRTVLFWLHLIIGLLAGVVILTMSATGVVLTYEKQIAGWADRRSYRAPAQGPLLPVSTLLQQARQRRGEAPQAVTVWADTAEPLEIQFAKGREFVHRQTGAVWGEGAPQVRAFLRSVIEWHRWFALSGEARVVARGVTGWANLGFLVLVLTGGLLWLRSRPILWFRSGLTGKARDFNWHNVLGLWAWAPLLIIVISGAVISFPWFANGLFAAAGIARPKPPAPEKKLVPLEGEVPSWTAVDEGLAQAMHRAPDWVSIAARLPASDRAGVVFTVHQGWPGQPQLRSSLIVSPGEPPRWEPFSSLDEGRRARFWLRFSHTGEYYGLAGQTIAGLASLGACVLVWTGGALSWRRFIAWRVRRTVMRAEYAGASGSRRR